MSVAFKNNFGKVMKRLVDGSAAAVIKPYADDLTKKIKAATPVKTGETQKSITSRQHSKFGHTISSDLLKARFIEIGTEDTPTFAMFRKTFDQNAVTMSRNLEKDFKALIENAAK